jgi:Na+/citrate or Na+/malate symporter
MWGKELAKSQPTVLGTSLVSAVPITIGVVFAIIIASVVLLSQINRGVWVWKGGQQIERSSESKRVRERRREHDEEDQEEHTHEHVHER